MSSREATKKISKQEMQLVQNHVEYCLRLYMNKKEVILTLWKEANIEPPFTEMIWQRLEFENPDFFKAYHARLMLKCQIHIFDKLLERQAEMMGMSQVGVASPPFSNGSHSSMHRAPFFVPEDTVPLSRTENGSVGTSSMFLSGGPSVQGLMPSIDDTSIEAWRAGISPDIHSQNSHIGMVHSMNGVEMKSEPGFAYSSAFAFNGDESVMGIPQPGGDMAIPSFGNVDTKSQSLSGSLLDNDASSFGFLGQMPRNFSVSNFMAGFSQYSDVGELLSSPGRECEGENRRLDTISEGLSNGFCSD